MKKPSFAKSRKVYQSEQILRYSPKSACRSTVRSYYEKWRQQHGTPFRCDIPDCKFYTEQPIWLGKSLPLILDHINGNSRDNSPENLRYICPNCDALLPTRGGANRGRVSEALDGKYILMSRDGKREYHLITDSSNYQLIGQAPTILIMSNNH